MDWGRRRNARRWARPNNSHFVSRSCRTAGMLTMSSRPFSTSQGTFESLARPCPPAAAQANKALLIPSPTPSPANQQGNGWRAMCCPPPPPARQAMAADRPPPPIGRAGAGATSSVQFERAVCGPAQTQSMARILGRCQQATPRDCSTDSKDGWEEKWACPQPLYCIALHCHCIVLCCTSVAAQPSRQQGRQAE